MWKFIVANQISIRDYGMDICIILLLKLTTATTSLTNFWPQGWQKERSQQLNTCKSFCNIIQSTEREFKPNITKANISIHLCS